jgi:hypothetical protein
VEAWLEEVLEEEEGVNRRPDGGIQVCLEATDMIPHPKTSDGWEAGVDGKCGGGATRAMRMSHPLLTLGGTEA